jgi:hypothetical protein
VYLVPAIAYPAGSGLPACGAIEAVYLNGVALAAANVREADLTAYVAPAGGDEHIAIMDRGNAAIKWIYKKFTVSSNGSGVLLMPSTARGLIAYITGVSAPAGRQDKAVITGLSNSSTYDVLCYHPPEAIEQWQFQILSPVYPGLKDAGALNDARVTTPPLAIAHSLGGGTNFSPPSRPLPDGDVLGHVIAWRLPVNADGSAIRDFNLDSAIALHDGSAVDSPPFQTLPALASQGGLTGLRPGQTITATTSVDTHPQGIGVALSVGGLPLGVYKPRLASDGRYQLAIAVGLEKNGDRWILVATFNGGTPTQGNVLAISSASPNLVGIDLFRYY